jgi:hypothetical protein
MRTFLPCQLFLGMLVRDLHGANKGVKSELIPGQLTEPLCLGIVGGHFHRSLRVLPRVLDLSPPEVKRSDPAAR